jgi:hypothetical protein
MRLFVRTSSRLARPASLLFGLFLLVSVAGCDSNDDDGDGEGAGEFTIEISGDIDRTFSGFAYFGQGEDPETGEEAFVIFLSNTEDVDAASSYAFIGRDSDRPGTGNYQFADFEDTDDLPENQFVLLVFLGDDAFFSTGGTLRLTTSNSNRVAGDFEATATGLIFSGGVPQEVEVEISGEFDAAPSDDLD